MIIVQRLGGGVRLVFGNLVFVFLVMLRLALATHRRPAVIDEHFFLFAVGGFGMGFGLVAFGLRAASSGTSGAITVSSPLSASSSYSSSSAAASDLGPVISKLSISSSERRRASASCSASKACRSAT